MSEHFAYRDNLEQILNFFGGRNLLNLADVKRFTGLKDSRTVHRLFPINADGYISAATLARCICTGGGKK